MSDVFSTVSATINADYTNQEILNTIKQSPIKEKLKANDDGSYTISGRWNDIAQARQILLSITHGSGNYITKNS